MSDPNYPPHQPPGYPPSYPQPTQQAQPGYPAPQGQPGYPQPNPYGHAQPGPGYGQPPYPQGHGQPAMPYAPQGFTPRTKLPGIVVAASIMWIIYGSLGLLGNLSALGASGGKIGGGGFFGLFIAVAFLVAGIQTLMGKAKGMLANGITSIVLGGLAMIAILALGAISRGFHLPPILFVVGFIFGALLITAGILACMGNKAYKEYRATKGL
jgi:hypothetical protein